MKLLLFDQNLSHRLVGQLVIPAEWLEYIAGGIISKGVAMWQRQLLS